MAAHHFPYSIPFDSTLSLSASRPVRIPTMTHLMRPRIPHPPVIRLIRVSCVPLMRISQVSSVSHVSHPCVMYSSIIMGSYHARLISPVSHAFLSPVSQAYLIHPCPTPMICRTRASSVSHACLSRGPIDVSFASRLLLTIYLSLSCPMYVSHSSVPRHTCPRLSCLYPKQTSCPSHSQPPPDKLWWDLQGPDSLWSECGGNDGS